MSKGYLPSRESLLRDWAQNFSTLVSATPTAFGLVALDATQLASLLTSFLNCYDAAVEPTTRTRVTIGAKNVAKAALLADVRMLVRKIQSTPTVTVNQKLALGITVPDRAPTPVPPPATKPIMQLVANSGRAIVARVADSATPTSRARPFATFGAEVFSYVVQNGEAAPADLEQWRYEGLARKATVAIRFGAADVGKTAVIKMRWCGSRGSGPVSEPATATIAA